MRLQECADIAAMADATDVQMRRRFYGGKTGEIVMIGKDSQRGPTPREREIEDLYDAICEGRRQDAIDVLQKVFPEFQFRSIKQQHNLFPERVPA